MTLSLEKKQAIKASDNKSTKKRKSIQTQEKILDYLKDNGRSTCAEIAGYIGLSPARTRAILSSIGTANANKRRYSGTIVQDNR